MVTVFGAFVMEDAVFLKLAGIGLATAVLVDATVVRMVLVPATMELLGDRNWWLPRWLDRLLPTIDVEGEDGIVDVDAPPTAAPTVTAPTVTRPEAGPDAESSRLPVG
jgi:RND superfamily putative drug exporter